MSIVTVLENGQDNEIYNVSSQNDFTDAEIYHMVSESIKSQEHREWTKKEIEVDQYRCFVRPPPITLVTEKLQALGWKPSRKIRERIKYTVGWYENNPWVLK
jgi:dTDP-D-glucose 4,6-dehydratase